MTVLVWKFYSLVVAVVVVGLMTTSFVHCEDGSRQKRDDAHKIIVTTITEEPYVMLKNPRGSGNENFEGLIPDMMNYISDKLKLHYEFRVVSDNKYGSKDSNGRWNGMIGEMLSGTADMAAAPMTISDERKKVIDFTVPFEEFGTVLLLLEPADGSEPTIGSMDDLAAQSDISYGIVRDGVTETFFKSSNIDTYKRIWENISKNPQNMVNKVEDGVEKVRSSGGKYVFIVESATAEYWVNKAPCNLRMVGDRVNSNAFAFALKKGDEYKEKLDKVITEMKASGKMNELRRKWKKGECGRDIYTDDISAAPPTGREAGASRQVATLALAVVALLAL